MPLTTLLVKGRIFKIVLELMSSQSFVNTCQYIYSECCDFIYQMWKLCDDSTHLQDEFI